MENAKIPLLSTTGGGSQDISDEAAAARILEAKRCARRSSMPGRIERAQTMPLKKKDSGVDHNVVSFISWGAEPDTSAVGGAARRPSVLKLAPDAAAPTLNPNRRLSFDKTLQERKKSIVEENMQRMERYGKSEETINNAWFVQDTQMSVFLWFNGMYYHCYFAWIFSAMMVGAVVMWAVSDDMDFFTAVFTSACCISQSGLAAVDWHAQNGYVHVTSIFVILAGSACLLTTTAPLLRRHSFRLQRAIEQRDGAIVQRDEESEREMNVEYKALGMVIFTVFLYWFLCHAAGFLLMYVYIMYHGDIQSEFQTLGLGPIWTTWYMTVSCFQNNGLVLTPSSLESYDKHPLILFVCGFLIMCGNTCLPIFVRFLATVEYHLVPKGDTKDALAFLLNNPRRCYTHMFPAVHTCFLLGVAVLLLFLQIGTFYWQDGSAPVLKEYEGWNMAANLFFQAATTRTAGLNSVDIFSFSLGSCYLMVVMMYLSCTPTVVMMRHSATDDGSETEVDITGRTEGLEEAMEGGDNSVRAQASRYLTEDLTYLTIIVFFICVFEKENFIESSEHASPAGNGIYGDFQFFKVIFEMASAYGTVGLSLGWRNAPYSFSGAWCKKSQFLLILAMLLGRMRGMPDSIDPSVGNFVERRSSKSSSKAHSRHGSKCSRTGSVEIWKGQGTKKRKNSTASAGSTFSSDDEKGFNGSPKNAKGKVMGA